MIDLDKNEKTYDDLWTPNKFYEDEECTRLPKIAIIGDGLTASRFSKALKIQKTKHQFIWLSSPDRGLEQVLDCWKPIKEKLPDATLKIYYGWEYFNTTLHIPAQRTFKEKIRHLLEQDGVEWCGRIGQEQLAKELMKSEFLLYPPPHEFRETYGIAFLEAQAAGVICFYRKNGALGETVGNRGIPLDTDMTPEQIADTIASVANDRKRCGILKLEGHNYAMNRDWSAQTDKLLKLYQILKQT